MKRIDTQDELTQFANQHGLRSDWHEPDEQEITARVEGVSFDNAGFWPRADYRRTRPIDPSIVEMHVIFSRLIPGDLQGRIEDLACVNLATLCSWAASQGPTKPSAPVGAESARQAALG
jgi:hypothetical protein